MADIIFNLGLSLYGIGGCSDIDPIPQDQPQQLPSHSSNEIKDASVGVDAITGGDTFILDAGHGDAGHADSGPPACIPNACHGLPIDRDLAQYRAICLSFERRDGVSFPAEVDPSLLARVHPGEPVKAAQWIGPNLLVGTSSGLTFYRSISGTNFLEDTQAAGLTDFDDINALAVGDANGDGIEDVYVGKETGTDVLFLRCRGAIYCAQNDGFTRSALPPETTQASTTAVAFVSLPSSLYPYIHVGRAGRGSVRDLFLERGADGSYVDRASDFGLAAPGQTTKIAWGRPLKGVAASQPMDATRPLGFISRFQQPSIAFFPKSGGPDFHFEEIGESLGLHFEGEVVGARWLDVDHDGREDLVVGMANGVVHLFVNKTEEVKICP